LSADKADKLRASVSVIRAIESR